MRHFSCFSFVAGVVPRERVPGFERMLWRISRGNVFLRRAELTQPLEDPATVGEYAINISHYSYIFHCRTLGC